jgi:hypothetical protein
MRSRKRSVCEELRKNVLDAADLQGLLDQVRAVISALQGGEILRANEQLAACRVHEHAMRGDVPPGEEGDELRAAVEEALTLAEKLQTEKRSEVNQGGATRRAIGAYGPRPR